MPVGFSARLYSSTGSTSRLALCVTLLIGAALLLAQQNQAQQSHSRLAYAADPANVPDAIAKVSSGQFGAVHLEMIANAHAVQAIPALEQQFNVAHDLLTTTKIASTLVRLGDTNSSYWDFLVNQATLAIQSPNPTLFDADGQQVRGRTSSQFTAWAKTNKIPPDAVYLLPALVAMLGETGDSRAIPLLRQGLSSPNPFIQAAAARGLANVHDTDSIPLIIDACRKAPDWGAAAIARSLVYFDDPAAQSAVDTYIPANLAKTYRAEKTMGVKP